MEMPIKLTGEQAHVTVLLSSEFGDTYKVFHCVGCGNVVFSYNEDKIRTILPGGHPNLGRPGKAIQCNGVIRLRRRTSAYDALYQIIDSAMHIDNIDDLREAIAFIAKDTKTESTFHCKMLYFVS